VSDSTVAEDFGHTTTDQIEKTYGRVPKERIQGRTIPTRDLHSWAPMFTRVPSGSVRQETRQVPY
jgi:hypothetical protein